MHESLVSGDDCTEAKGGKKEAKKEGKRERRRRREWREMEAGSVCKFGGGMAPAVEGNRGVTDGGARAGVLLPKTN